MKRRKSTQRKYRLISLFLVAAMCLSGCGGKGATVDVEPVDETDVPAVDPEATEGATVVEPEVTEKTQEAVATEPLEPEEAEEMEESEDVEDEAEEPEEVEAWDPDSVTTDESWITFGSYEQDNDLTNGAEPIEWRILKQEEGRILLMSRFGLDAKQYNETDDDVTWETCTLREWLNDKFFNTAFDEEERILIEPTYIETADNPEAYPNTIGGNPTTDRLFLLSGEEAEEYLKIAIAAQPTEYAKAQGVYIGNNGNAKAWLRSPGGVQNGAQTISSEGVVDKQGDYNSMIYHAVCPAMWVTMTDDISSQIMVGDIQIGSTVLFGHYEQNDMREGKEQVEWTVLDVKDGKMLLFWQDVEDVAGFDKVGYHQRIDKSFYDEAFTQQEKEYIVLTKLKPSDTLYYPNYGSIEEQYVFILNCEEAGRYLVGSEGTHGWLRDSYGSGAWCLTSDGVKLVNMDDMKSAVHPAMWVDTDVLQSGLTDKEAEQGLGSIDDVMTVIDEEKKYVTFGRYEQDNNLENGSEPIEWIVLKQDDEQLMLISRYELDAKQYHEIEDIDDYTSVTWERCTLREWLNGEFLETAFNEQEQQFMVSKNIRVSHEYTDDTILEDYVYLLSSVDVEYYFGKEYAEEQNRWQLRSERSTNPTPYAESQPYAADQRGYRSSWLLSDSMGCGRVHLADKPHISFEGWHKFYIRPVIWVSVND